MVQSFLFQEIYCGMETSSVKLLSVANNVSLKNDSYLQKKTKPNKQKNPDDICDSNAVVHFSRIKHTVSLACENI